MKNPKLKFSLVVALVITLTSIFSEQSKASYSNSTVTETIVVDGKIYPLVNLPTVEINPLKAKNQTQSEYKRPDMSNLLANSSKMVLVQKHNDVYMPSVLLNEAVVIADGVKQQSAFSVRHTIKMVVGFVFSNLIHLGVIR